MIQFIAAGAVGALVWTGYRAFKREVEKLEREDEAKELKSTGRLKRDESGRYRVEKD